MLVVCVCAPQVQALLADIGAREEELANSESEREALGEELKELNNKLEHTENMIQELQAALQVGR